MAQLIAHEETRRSEARLREVVTLQRAVIDGADYSIIFTDANGTIRGFNAAAERMLGYRAEEVVGKATLAVIHDPDELVRRAARLSYELGRAVEPGFEALVAVCRSKRVEEREWTYVRKNGVRFPVLLSVTALNDAQGEISGFLGIAQDLTERKRVELELYEKDILLRRLSERVPGVIYQYRYYPDGRSCFPYASERIREIYEVSPEDVREDACIIYSRLHPEDRAAVSASIVRSYETLTPWRCEYRVVLPQRGLRWLRGEAMPERLADESVLWHGYIADITESKLVQLRAEREENLLRHIADGLASATGEAFFHTLTRALAQALDVDFAFVGEYMPGPAPAVQILALQARGASAPPFRYALADTPCADVMSSGLCCIPREVQRLYPRDALLTEMGIHAYVGTPLRSSSGQVLGILVVLHGAPLEAPELAERMLRIFGVRAAAELERQLQARELAAKEARYRLLFESAGHAILLMRNGRFIDCNVAAQQLFSCEREEIVGAAPRKFYPPVQSDGLPSAPRADALIAAALSGMPQRFEWLHRRLDGRCVETEVGLNRVDIDGHACLYVSIHDISERKAAQAQLAQSRAELIERNASLELVNDLSRRLHGTLEAGVIFEEAIDVLARFSGAMGVAVFERDPTREVMLLVKQRGLNERIAQRLQRLPVTGSLTGRALMEGHILVSADVGTDARVDAVAAAAMAACGVRAVAAIPLASGSQSLGTITLLFDHARSFTALELESLGTIATTISLALVNARHITALAHMAHHDVLTDLANRLVLHREFNQLVRGPGGTPRPAGLLLLDLDRFKEVNDTLGHHVGDSLLKQVARRLEAELEGRPALLCRLGGDEFAVLLPGADELESRATAQRLLDALRRPYRVEDVPLEIGASVGIARYPQDGIDSHALLRSADVAMYAAKRMGTGLAVYAREQDPHTPERLAMMADLGEAIRGGQLRLHFQPKLDLVKGQIVGFEALVRWQHPRHGLLYPDTFLPLAEMGETIHPLLEAVLDLALAQSRAWKREGRRYTVAVNLSARNLIDDRCVAVLEKLLDRYQAEPGDLELEITETALMHDPEGAVVLLHRIARLGVGLSIDDFGSGYSSLAYLRRLPIQVLKIDRVFVRDMLKNEQDAIIVRSTIGLAHNLQLKVIAEGVEDAATLARLREMGCDQVQGYYLSKPIPADALEHWLAVR